MQKTPWISRAFFSTTVVVVEAFHESRSWIFQTSLMVSIPTQGWNVERFVAALLETVGN